MLALAVLPGICGVCDAAERLGTNPVAYRWAVPVLCTETRTSARTKVRGTAVVIDERGVILTAAHVVLGTNLFCALTVLVPEDHWNITSRSHAFSVQQCATEMALDLAVCQIVPAEHRKDAEYLRAPKLRRDVPSPDSPITITGFWGWGMLPVPRRGRLTSHLLYKRQDGAFCDFSTDVVAFEGMSGSPVITEEGDLIGVITITGVKKFAGSSYGVSIGRAEAFLRANRLTIPAE